VNKVIVGLVVAVIALAAGVSFLAYSSQDQIDETVTKLTNSVISYKYDSICDVGDLKEFVEKKALPVWAEILEGIHNENEKLIEFYKSNKFLRHQNITPSQIYGPDTPPNKDPAIIDFMFLLPVILEIMNTNPELIEILTLNEGESENEYLYRLEIEKNKCS